MKLTRDQGPILKIQNNRWGLIVRLKYLGLNQEVVSAHCKGLGQKQNIAKSLRTIFTKKIKNGHWSSRAFLRRIRSFIPAMSTVTTVVLSPERRILGQCFMVDLSFDLRRGLSLAEERRRWS